ncbi:MAG: FtsX-like permease family protein [Thermodesulfovibrionales bacterium]|nr:FtsX-like permease family protein [Thermodesulfovibrionales bacterium]
MLTIFVTLDNRRRQIAVLRAIGATPAYVFSSVWLYMTFLMLVGTGLGILLGWLSAHLLSVAFHARTGLHLPVIISGQELILATSLILAGMLLAIIPAWMSYRLPVAESLKMQG